MRRHIQYIFTARKRSLGQGNVFTGVYLFYLSTGEGKGVGFPAYITGHMTRGSASRDEGVGLHPGGRGRGLHTPPAGTRKAGGTHPTGMLPCRTNARNEVCTRIGTNFVPVPILEQAQFKICEIPPWVKLVHHRQSLID